MKIVMKRCCLAVLLLMMWCSANAQTPVVANNTETNQSFIASVQGGGGTGQSFVSPGTYDMTAISIRSARAGTATLRIYDNADATGTPIYEQTGILLTTGSNSNDSYTLITLNTSVPIVTGQSYSFIFDNAQLYVTSNDNFTDGNILTGAGLTLPRLDLFFEVFASNSSNTVTTSIPTMSLWSFILLYFAVLGVTKYHRKISC